MDEMQYAVVTGSSSGLGLEMAEYLVQEGYFVFGLSRSGNEIEHENFVPVECDVKEEDQVNDAFDQIQEYTNKLDIIVNNAGICEMGSLVETSSQEFSEHLNTNCLGAFHVFKNSHDFIVEDKTHFITIASVAAKKGYANVSAYAASKFALKGLVESVKDEWASMGVRFTTLYPGAIDTPLWESLQSVEDRDKMLSVDEFLHIFDMIVKAPENLQLPEVHLMHKNSVME